MGERSRLAMPEWKAALDAAQGFDFVGAGGPVGYWGVSMGTAIGVPFVASEPRITAAVFGLAGLREGATEYARPRPEITIPVEFVFQWEDAVAPREAGIALFNAFASAEKTMHINPGGHMDIPDFEGASWERFFVRHLGVAVAGEAGGGGRVADRRAGARRRRCFNRPLRLEAAAPPPLALRQARRNVAARCRSRFPSSD